MVMIHNLLNCVHPPVDGKKKKGEEKNLPKILVFVSRSIARFCQNLIFDLTTWEIRAWMRIYIYIYIYHSLSARIRSGS